MSKEVEALDAIESWARGIVNAAAAELERHPGNDKVATEKFIYWCDCPKQREAFKALRDLRAHLKGGE